MSTSASPQESQPVAESPPHELRVYRCGKSGNGNRRVVSSLGDAPLYFVQNSALAHNAPDVTVFAGSDKTGAVVGVCKYTALSSDIVVGRGDPALPNTVVWETLTKRSRDHSAYAVTLAYGAGARKAYTWKRTHDADLLGRTSSWLNQRSWKLVDDDEGAVVALFAAQGMNSWRNTGEVRFLEHRGKEWEEWVVLMFFGIYEKARRRALARRDLSWFV